MSEIKLLPCPFCEGDAERITLDDPENFGGDVICCTRCQASSHVEFGRKENLVDAWNTRAALSSAAVAEREPVGTLTTGDLKLLKAGNSVVANPMAVAPHRDQVNLYLDPPLTSELEAENARLRDERDEAVLRGWKAALDCVTYAAANSYGPRVDSKAVSEARDALVTELIIGSPGDYLDVEWKGAQDAVQAIARALDAEARLVEAMNALEPFATAAGNFDGFKITNEDEWFAYGGSQSAEKTTGAITVADLRTARRVREGGKVE